MTYGWLSAASCAGSWDWRCETMIFEYKVTDVVWDKGPYDFSRMVKIVHEIQ